MAVPETLEKGCAYHSLPQHGMAADVTEKRIAENLFELLCKEIKMYIEGHRRLGILLSGGMGSRIVAAVNFINV